MMLASPHKLIAARPSTQFRHKSHEALKSVMSLSNKSFNDEANMIERTESRRIFDYETTKELAMTWHERQSHAHTHRYKENIAKMRQRRKRGVIEICAVEGPLPLPVIEIIPD